MTNIFQDDNIFSEEKFVVKVFLAFLAVTTLTKPDLAQTETWFMVGVYGTTKQATSMTFIDVASLRFTGKIRRAWTATISSDFGVINGHLVTTLKQLEEFDCSEGMARTLSYAMYDRDGISITSDSNMGKWNYMIPGTSGYDLLISTCNGPNKKYQSRPDFNPITDADGIMKIIERHRR